MNRYLCIAGGGGFEAGAASGRAMISMGMVVRSSLQYRVVVFVKYLRLDNIARTWKVRRGNNFAVKYDG